ncbi:MAG: AbrB/MazE/SpoVT family DNA-binding domain-containing protein [Candidatus Bathyarchaeota archaeon]|nr:MAG: AbrB/MazE/SpoVT family DNA-binding domain-containing protein [Candidatus Bathyarchaeota archaeon]
MEKSEKMKCYECGGEMQADILETKFPKGSLPIRGYKCSLCGYELIPFEAAEKVQHLAETLGLFGEVNPLQRKVTKCGNNLAVYIPKQIEEQLGLEKGTPIYVWLKNDEICIKTR